ncbi:glycosyltransferase family 4 protein [Vibrio vulnificus]|uniref:glycosyltransferase family 4 protein n=1 Tax=Vibrio vulnificus TaxID=672 RepID=UPI0037C446F2
MNLLFYLPSLAPSGGIERVVTTIANELSEIYSITILTQDKRASFYHIAPKVKLDSLSNYNQLNMNSKFSRVISQAKNIYHSVRNLANYLSDKEFDFIYHTHPISHLELLLAGVSKDKIVISEHGASNNYNFIYRLIKSFSYKKCHLYCVPTTTDCEYYSQMGFPAVYIPHYRPRLEYVPCNLNSKVVLNIGRYTDDKKQLVLLKIWNDIDLEIRQEWTLNIVGDGELKSELLAYIRENDLSKSVILSPPVSDISKYYKTASVFALTSRSEGFGMVLLEAAGFGMPLISFNCPSGPKDIINKNNGFLIENNDIESYKKKLTSMMLDEELRNCFSSGSFSLVNEWSNNKITGLWKDVFR